MPLTAKVGTGLTALTREGHMLRIIEHPNSWDHEGDHEDELTFYTESW